MSGNLNRGMGYRASSTPAQSMSRKKQEVEMAGSWASAKLSGQIMLNLGRHGPNPASRRTATLGAGQSHGRHPQLGWVQTVSAPLLPDSRKARHPTKIEKVITKRH